MRTSAETAARAGALTEQSRSPDEPPPAEEASTGQVVPVALGEVAEVRVTLTEPENMVRLDGRRCIGLEIYKEARHNTIDAVDSIHEQLEVLRRSLPGYQIETVQDQARFIQAAVTEVESALIPMIA